MKNRLSSRPLVIFVISVALGLAGGTGVALTGALSSDEARPVRGPMPEDINRDGMISDTGAERVPELVKAIGDDGTPGYIRIQDTDESPASPAEALRLQEARASGKGRQIPLYAEDGKTVIGTFTERLATNPGAP